MLTKMITKSSPWNGLTDAKINTGLIFAFFHTVVLKLIRISCKDFNFVHLEWHHQETDIQNRQLQIYYPVHFTLMKYQHLIKVSYFIMDRFKPHFQWKILIWICMIFPVSKEKIMYSQWARKLKKKSRPKNSWNQINQFQEICFWTFSVKIK